MVLKLQLEAICEEYRRKLNMSPNPGLNGLQLKWAGEKDWSICYKGVRYTPDDFYDVGFDDVGFIERVIKGEEVDIEEKTQERVKAESAANLSNEIAATVEEVGDVKSASYPTTNMLLIFDKNGDEIADKCSLKLMKVDGTNRVDHLIYEGNKIGEIKNGKVTLTNSDFESVVAKDVDKNKLREKRDEIVAQREGEHVEEEHKETDEEPLNKKKADRKKGRPKKF